METINKFKSFCGKLFDTAEECIRYEKISRQVENLLAKYPRINSCDFTNGNGYIQHNPGAKKEIEKELIRLSNEWFIKWIETDGPFTHFNYFLGRIIDDSNMSCLNKLSYKLMCIDENEREYGQPYYANHPQEVKGGQLN